MQRAQSLVVTVGIGGAAGDGVLEAGKIIGQVLAHVGYHVYVSVTYPSLIRGGHNFTRISFSPERVWNDHEKLDVLIALNDESISLHRRECKEGALIIAEHLTELATQAGASKLSRNSVALGILMNAFGLPLTSLHTLLKQRGGADEANLRSAQLGYEHGAPRIQLPLPEKFSYELSDGNTAFAQGLLAAGLEFYVSYPMTPTTGILHYLARVQNNSKVRVIQPESELAVINMALGIAYAGKRVAIGSASGGFALMQEGFSFAGIAELPLVVAVAQRQGPATGVPTYSSQTDLRFVIHAGHGEFPRIVIAPGDPEEAFHVGALALNLAWKYQVPVIVLLDKILSEHSMTVSPLPRSVSIESGKNYSGPAEEYQRYTSTPDGISPLAFPGMPGITAKVNSYEHDEHGITVEEQAPVEMMIEKRRNKAESIRSALSSYETVRVSGDLSSDTVLLFWGSTKGAVYAAVPLLSRSVKLVQVLWMEPFDIQSVTAVFGSVKKIICIEANQNGQLAGLVREHTGIAASELVLKYDSRPFTGEALATELNLRLHSSHE